MLSLRRPRRSAAAAGVAALVGAVTVVVAAPQTVQAAASDQLAVVVASGASYSQSFPQTEGAVGVTYTLVGATLAQDKTSTALMNAFGSGVGFSPSGVSTTTGAQIDNDLNVDCGGGNGVTTSTDCATAASITIAFDSPVTDPTLHVAGLGDSQASADGANFATYFDLSSSASSTEGKESAALGPLVGTPTNLQITEAGRLETTGLRPGSSCDTAGDAGATSTAGCGSVKVTGTDLTSITLGLGIRNSGAAFDASSGPGRDTFALTTSIPVAPVTGSDPSAADSSEAGSASLKPSSPGVGSASGADPQSTTTVASDPPKNSNASLSEAGSIQVEQNILGRVNGTDQFTMNLSGDSLTAPLSGTTTGTSTGLQTDATSIAGPAPASGDADFTFSETAATGTSTDLSDYVVTYSCTNLATEEVIANGTGTSGAVTIPQAGADTDVSVDCEFTDADSGIAVQASTDSPVYHHGDPVTYTITVTNVGHTALADLAVTDPLTESCAKSFDTLAAADSTTYTCTGTAGLTDIDNTTDVSATAPTGKTVKASAVARASVINPGITLTATASPTGVAKLGQQVNYTFDVENVGDTPVTDLVIADKAVAPADPVPTISCDTTSIAVGASTQCAGTYDVTQADLDNGSINNAATATAKDPLDATVTSNQSMSSVEATQTRSLTVAASVAPTSLTGARETVQYSFEVTNDGNVTASGLTIDDSFTAPAGPAPAPTCLSTTLIPGDETTCTTSYTATIQDANAATIVNSVTAHAVAPDKTMITSDPSVVSVLIAARPSLLLAESVSPDAVDTLGQTVNYTFAVTNTGNVTVSGLAVADTLAPPAGPSLADITCDDDSLDPGAMTTCSVAYAVTQDDLDHGVIGDSATVSGTTPAGLSTESAPSIGEVTVDQAPKLALTKTADPTTVTAAKQPVRYSFAVTNTGNVTVRELAIDDDLAAPAAPALTITCPATPLAPKSVATCSATYRTSQLDIDNGSIDNSAVANANAPGDAVVASNSSTATVSVDQSPGLSLTTSASPSTVSTLGQRVTYSFAVVNTGNTTVNDLSIQDTLVSPAGPAFAINCLATTLVPNAKTTCTGVYPVTQDDLNHGAIDNSATVSGVDAAGTPVMSDPSALEVAVVQKPALTLVTSASPSTVDPRTDTTVTYSFLVTNSGNVSIDGLSVADTLAAPAGPAPTVTCVDTSLEPAANTTCSASYTVIQADIDAGSITNSATASGVGPDDTAVSSPKSSALVEITQSLALVLVKTADPMTVTVAGQLVDYSFTVTNTGDVTVDSLSITDTLTAPAGPALKVTCPATPLAPDGTSICSATYKATQADIDNGSIVNLATASALGPQGQAVTSPRAKATVAAPASPGVSVVKSSSVATANAAGDPIRYYFAVTNTGNVSLTGIAVNDPLLTGTSKAICPPLTLAPGARTTCTANYSLTQIQADAGVVTNTATVTADTPAGDPITSAPSSVTVTIPSAPSLAVLDSASPATVHNVGDRIAYSIRVTNTGNVTITGVTAANAFVTPAGPPITPVCAPASLAPAESTTCTASYRTTAADFDHGTIRTSATATGTPPRGTAVTSSQSNTVTVTAVAAPAISIVTTAAPHDLNADNVIDVDDAITYTFVLANTGNVTLNDVTVTDQFAAPAGPALTVTCPSVTLAAGASITCFTSADHVIDQADVDAGRITNRGSVTAQPVTGRGRVIAANDITNTLGSAPALTLVATGAPVDSNDDGRTDAGDQVRWTFTVTNSGNVTIVNLSVVVPSGGVITCPVTSLLPGASTTCKASTSLILTVRDLDVGSVTNTGTVGGIDPTGGAVESAPSTATVPLPDAPGLSLIKTGSLVDVNHNDVNDAGDTLSWKFLITNSGNVTLAHITVRDPKASGIDCPRTTLAPAASMTCSTAAEVITAADVAAQRLSNTATVAGMSGGRADTPVLSAPSTATVSTSGSAATSPTGNIIGRSAAGVSASRVSAVAFTGAKNLSILMAVSVGSVLLGLLLTLAGLRGRRRHERS